MALGLPPHLGSGPTLCHVPWGAWLAGKSKTHVLPRLSTGIFWFLGVTRFGLLDKPM